ncbi:MAG: tetraacyldisaccharide 4'-kinase [Candidatus Poribacteria bacterium]|nr:tetraacyldisaccharide 4'-kinase [Candidatus Poribacteria bacterium]
MEFTRSRDLASLQKKFFASPIRFLLIPLSWLYGAIISIRNRLYALGVFKTRTLPCRVISVGNIVVGGTGKTPAVITIAKYLQKEGKRVAILLRGYKRHVREEITIVSDGKKVCASPTESGDEAYMMTRHLSDIPIIAGKCRYLAGQVALERFNVDVLILDDGFQHRQLARDIDILTVPATHPFGNPRGLLPIGTLREPTSALRRADLILLTHADAPNVSLEAKEAVKQLAPNALILESVHQPIHLYPLASENSERNINVHIDIKELKGKRLLAVCGIGNPDTFVATLMRCLPENVELLAFPDHHVYTEADRRQIHAAFQASGADLIVTTQKDEEKLARIVTSYQLPVTSYQLLVLAISLVIKKDSEQFTDMLLASH